jgi:hypothetical protein
MKIEVEREIRLPAFDLERGDLELLLQRMTALFENGASLRMSISLSLPSQRLTFDSIQEFNDYQPLRGQVTNFSLDMRQNSRSVELSTGGLFTTAPMLRVKGDSDVWCAGAIESVVHVIRQHRAWYFWLVRIPFTTIFLLVCAIPWTKAGPFSAFPEIPLSLLFSWLALTVLFGYFSFFKKRLLPVATLTFTREVGFIRKYGSELGLALGAISLVLSIYMWIVPFKG